MCIQKQTVSNTILNSAEKHNLIYHRKLGTINDLLSDDTMDE